ncbi:MAG: MBL fold metallo-hydrolase [Actinomycetota bacterium]|nr:MBL fold metallo-hydrolase [Actinomycetota bacterium]
MRLTHYGHACVLVETDSARILIDPGTLSTGFEPVRGLDAILITHDHPDHLDVDRLPALLAGNLGAELYSDAGTAPVLASLGVLGAEPGATLTIGGTTVEVLGGSHAPIYADIPGSGNVAYSIDGGAFFHPGDSFEMPTHPVDVLGLPVSAPWLKLAEAIDYLRAVAPRVAVPIHQADLVDTGTSYFMVGHFTPDGTTFRPIEQQTPTEF